MAIMIVRLRRRISGIGMGSTSWEPEAGVHRLRSSRVRMMMMRLMFCVVRLVFFNNHVQKNTVPAGDRAKLLRRQVHRLLGVLRFLRHSAFLSGFIAHGWPPPGQEERYERAPCSVAQFEHTGQVYPMNGPDSTSEAICRNSPTFLSAEATAIIRTEAAFSALARHTRINRRRLARKVHQGCSTRGASDEDSARETDTTAGITAGQIEREGAGGAIHRARVSASRGVDRGDRRGQVGKIGAGFDRGCLDFAPRDEIAWAGWLK